MGEDRDRGAESKYSILSLLERTCREALEDDAVGPESDFLELGGNSLTAMSIASVVAAELGGDVEVEHAVLRALFEESTLAAAAANLNQHFETRVELPRAGEGNDTSHAQGP